MKKVLMTVAVLMMAGSVYADDQKTVSEKASEAAGNAAAATKEAAQDTGKAIKKGGRAAADKTCEMINGKMECAAKKVKHKVQNAADEVKDKAND